MISWNVQATLTTLNEKILHCCGRSTVSQNRSASYNNTAKWEAIEQCIMFYQHQALMVVMPK